MSVTAKETKPREITPAGSHIARCFSLIHYGHVPETDFNGNRVMMNKVRLSFELPNETRVFDPEKGEQPMSISKEYTVSLGEKSNMRKDLEGWRGKSFTAEELAGFDVLNIVGKPCLLNVIHKTSKSSGNNYAMISSISPLAKGMTCPDQINPTFIWDYDDHFDTSILEGLHEFFQEKIKSSQEYKDKLNPVQVQDAPMPTAEDVPPEDPENTGLPF